MKYVGGIVVVAVVAAAGYGIYEATKPTPVVTPTPTATVTQTVTASVTPVTPTPELTPLEKLRIKLLKKLDDHVKEATINWTQCKDETINVAVLAFPTQYPNYEATLPRFQKLTGITVNLDYLPEVELREKTTLDLLSRTGIYDVAMVDNMHLALLAKENTLEPLETYINDSKFDPDWWDWNDFYPADRQSASPEPWAKGHVLMVPYCLHGVLLHYRKDLLEEYGVKVPETMDELMEAAKVLHNPEKGYVGFASRGLRGEGLNVFTWTPFFRAFGGKWFTKDWMPAFNDENGVRALEFYTDILTSYGPKGIVSWDWSHTTAAICEGITALEIDCDLYCPTGWDPGATKPELIGKWWCARVPAGPAGRDAEFFNFSLAVNKESKHKVAAWLFIEYLYSKYSLMIFDAPIGIPARQSFWKDEDVHSYYEGIDDFVKVNDTSKREDTHMDCRPVIPEWPEVGDTVGEAISASLAKEKTPKDALDEAAKKVYATMKKAGYYK